MKQTTNFRTYSICTLHDLLWESANRYRERVAVASKIGGFYRKTSYLQLQESVVEVMAALNGIEKKNGEPIALLGENRTEWAVVYLAIVCSGKVVIPIDRDLKIAEIREILELSGAKTVFSSIKFLSDLVSLRSSGLGICNLISLEDDLGGADFSFSQFRKRGDEAQKEEMIASKSKVRPDDLVSILFTSGTMGASKGVMLTHKNLCSNIMAISQFVSVHDGDRLLSILPLHHTYECTCGFLTALYQGASIYYSENLRRIPENLIESKATVVLGVPLFFETMYQRIKNKILLKGKLKIQMALWICTVSDIFGFSLRRRIFRTLHDKLGGKLRLFISGGAALNPDVSRGFRDLGINCIQGYGMTEASPLISVNREESPVDKSVGMPVPGVEVRIANGEIIVRGPNVMKGYFGDNSSTKKALVDGWLHTGDLGFIDENGFIFINGRKKSVIITPNGKNVYPEELEARLNERLFIKESLVWGGASKDPALTEVQAIVVPDIDAFEEHYDIGECDNSVIEKMIAKEVKQVNLTLANYKRIRKFIIRNNEFTKTTTRKIKRYLYT